MNEYIKHEATCKDCLHYCVCKDTVADENWYEDSPQRNMFSPKGCENYKPAADVVEVLKINAFIQRLRNTPGTIYHFELKQICEEFGFDYFGAKMDGKGEY